MPGGLAIIHDDCTKREVPMPDRLALIVANSDFRDPQLARLNTPLRDAEALAEVLADPAIGAFDVTLLVDEAEAMVRRQVTRLYQRRRPDDLLLLYYSGHGIRDDQGDLYLATHNTEMDLVGGTALEAAFVRTRIDKSRSRRKVVILDCCHSGAFAGGKSGLGDSVGTQDIFGGYGRVILTASDALELAWEGGEWLGAGAQHLSVFTHFLVEGLRTGAADRNGDGQIDLDELYDYAYERVVGSGRASQTPHKWAERMRGRIVIARNPHPRESGLPPGLQRAVESREVWTRTGAVNGLEHMLRAGAGEAVDAARAALARLAADEDPRVAAAAARVLGLEVESETEPPVLKPVSPPAPPEPEPDALTLTAPIELELVRVPAGPFLMGSDPAQDEDARDREQPQHTVELSTFCIGKYPVTNAQYAVFVRATDHRVPRHWKEGEIPASKTDHPVVYVSWRDAVAFCDWLRRETGRPFRLPGEAEWEKAARGTDGWIYPWGDEPPTDERCNFARNVGGTTPVGRYSPGGDSPYGCADMAGNVWEWTRSLWGENLDSPDFGYPYDLADGRNDPHAEGLRVLRGGSWLNLQGDARCPYRLRDLPDPFDSSLGFRVVASLANAGF
jgi:formylglycine-generating enzyme required for sulfatase activity/uncharacterized caspase-like protein